MSGRPRSRRWALALASFAAGLVVCEVALAVFRPVEFMRPVQRVEGGGRWRNVLHRASEIEGLAYELTPGSEGSHRGASVRINSLGMRDDEPSGGAVRIAVVGDSTTFGFAVEAEETYASVLEELLEERFAGVDFETLNFGVGGYSTRDEALVLEARVLPLEPDLVIVGYSLNDADPRPIQPLHQHFVRPRWWQHSNLLRLVARWSHAGTVLPDGGARYTDAIYAEDSATWRSVRDGFASMASATAAREIPVLLVVFPRLKELATPPYALADVHEQVLRAGREAGFDVLDLAPVYARWPVARLMNPRDVMHPSVFGHRVAARAIAERVARDRALLARAGLDRDDG